MKGCEIGHAKFLMSSTEFLRSDFDLLLVFEFWWARALEIGAVRRPGECLACVLEVGLL